MMAGQPEPRQTARTARPNPAPGRGLAVLDDGDTGELAQRTAEPRGRPALLEVSGLTDSFGPLTVLREVSLQVGPSQIVAVAGGNGAGKSTLIGTIAGVLDADAGEVKSAGRPMPRRRPSAPGRASRPCGRNTGRATTWTR